MRPSVSSSACRRMQPSLHGISWAKYLSFDHFFAVYQGEGNHGIQEVSGSIPLLSTRKGPEIARFQDLFWLEMLWSVLLTGIGRGGQAVPDRGKATLYLTELSAAFVFLQLCVLCMGNRTGEAVLPPERLELFY